MFGTFPIRMKYTSIPGRQEATVAVDVYEFRIIEDQNAVALCWFVYDKKWDVVSIDQLVPVKQKSLNE